MIELRSLGFHYPGQPPIFNGYQWTAEAGDAWAVLGPSGCGKSTLLYLIAGILQPTSGEINIDQRLLKSTRPETGLILQDYGLLPWATIRQNAELGLQLRRFYGPDGKHAPMEESTHEVSEVSTYWLNRLGLMQVTDQFPSQVSGGQRQRTAIARTLALNPDLLLMDEPFASLDAPTRETLQKLVIELRSESQMTTIIVTHTIEEAAFLGKKVLVLNQPPNSTPRIIDNPSAGSSSYLQSAPYYEMCALLRQTLDQTT